MINSDIHWSLFSHVISWKGKSALYNSLTQEIIGFKDESMAGKVLTSDPSGLGELTQVLVDTGFIVQNSDDDLKKINSLFKLACNKPLSTLYLVPSFQCNMSCRYCHIIKNATSYNSNMSLSEGQMIKEVENFMNQANQEGASHVDVVFYGGEPLLQAAKVFTIAKYIRTVERSMPFSVSIHINTNGTLLTKNNLSLIQKYDILNIVSIDGPAYINDKMRVFNNGKGTFNAIEKNLNLSNEMGIKFGISVVVSSHNISRLEECYQYLSDRFSPLDFGFSTLHLFDNGEHPEDPPIEITTKALLDVFSLSAARGDYCEHMFRKLRPIINKKPRIYDCPACGGKMLVAPDGRIGVCEAHAAQQKYLVSSKDINAFNELRKIVRDITPFNRSSCMDCLGLGVCGGGCFYDAEKSSGSIYGLDLRRCKQSQLIVKWAVERICELYLEQNKNKKNSIFFHVDDSARKALAGQVSIAEEGRPLSSFSGFGEAS